MGWLCPKSCFYCQLCESLNRTKTYKKEIARGIFVFANKRESRAGSKNRAGGEI